MTLEDKLSESQRERNIIKIIGANKECIEKRTCGGGNWREPYRFGFVFLPINGQKHTISARIYSNDWKWKSYLRWSTTKASTR